MKFRFTAVLILVLIWSCNRPGTIPELTIPNSAPSIVRIAPTEDRLIASPESDFSVTVQAADNEGIYKISVLMTRFIGPWTPTSVPVLEVDSLVGEYYLNSTNGQWTFNHTLPPAAMAPFGYTVRYRFQAIDLDSNKVHTDYYVNVMDLTPSDTDSVLTYDSCWIYNNLKGQFQYYSFYFNTNSPSSSFDRDIQESTTTAPGFNMQFVSPNNAFAADTTVFGNVTSYVNYEAISKKIDSYTIVDNAYKVCEPKLPRTGTLQVGDIYIAEVKSSGQPYQPYVIFKILQVIDAPGIEDDRILFTYKRVIP
jgi:hypothetical protein